MASDPYYQADLAMVHHLGFGAHADACAPGILARLEPVLATGGLVLELGCGSGLLTSRLVEAGHRVLATDASPAMLELAARTAPGAEAIERLTLPDDPLPAAAAVVSIGHVLNYLPDAAAVERGLAAIAGALEPGGLLALDLCDLSLGAARAGAPNFSKVGEDWAIVTRFATPAPDRFRRDITTFVATGDGGWRRADERHDNVLVDTAQVPALLAGHGIDAQVLAAFGTETLPAGLVAVVGAKRVT